MSLFPFYRHRFLSDPFIFYDPWFDFDIFPPFPSFTRPNSRVTEHERITYQTTTETRNTTNRVPLPPPPPPPLPLPPPLEDFRVQLNIDGFRPETINTKVEGRKMIVEAKQEDRHFNNDYQLRELRKTYDIPEYVDTKRMTSIITPNNMLNIRIPVRKYSENERRLVEINRDDRSLVRFNENRDRFFDDRQYLNSDDLHPRIVDKPRYEKQVEVTVGVKDYQPEDLRVSVKNNELIVQGEHQHSDANHSERSYFFKSTTLPPGTQIDRLQSRLTNDGQLKIEAPFLNQREL